MEVHVTVSTVEQVVPPRRRRRRQAMEASKLAWLVAHLRCPRCEGWPLDVEGMADALICVECGARYGWPRRAAHLLDGDLAGDYHIEATGNVSDHPFDGNADAIIGQVGARGGMVLDCGSGLKTVSYPHVVQMEIVEYPLVDVLGVNQRLPFVDDCFDAVFSLDVLEHVDQPFTSAAEIARVLRPGGTLYIDLPFLQPEHGYPHHYFNATRQGLLRLFEGHLDVVRHVVPRSGQPIALLHWALGAYVQGLDPIQRQRLLGLTVCDLISRDPLSWLDDPIVAGLAEETRWVLASATQAVLRKPPAPPGGGPTAASIDPASLPGFAAPDPDPVASPAVSLLTTDVPIVAGVAH
jgi:SAM-dependent methyltransferase